MRFARCSRCRSECVFRHGIWKHVYERANKDCVIMIDEDSEMEVEKW